MSNALEFVHPSQDPNMELVYCCRRCRTPLFRPSHLSAHEPGLHHFSYHRVSKDVANAGDISQSGHARLGANPSEITALDEPSRPKCTSYFLEDSLQWMKDVIGEVENKLTCPNKKCNARLGSLKWAGSQCSCGTWVSPAIQLNKTSCDERYFPKSQAETK